MLVTWELLLSVMLFGVFGITANEKFPLSKIPKKAEVFQFIGVFTNLHFKEQPVVRFAENFVKFPYL